MTTTTATATLTTENCTAVWIYCDSIGAVDGMRMAATARRDIVAGRRDTLAVQWAAARYVEIPVAARIEIEAALAE